MLQRLQQSLFVLHCCTARCVHLDGASFCVAIVNHYSVIIGYCFVFVNV